jgi:sulfur-carrier protein
MIRVILPAHLRNLSRTGDEVELDVAGPVTIEAILNALESAHPTLVGTVRDHATHKRRSFVRFFACGEDWSHNEPGDPLPEDIAHGREPLLIVGAIAGGLARADRVGQFTHAVRKNSLPCSHSRNMRFPRPALSSRPASEPSVQIGLSRGSRLVPADSGSEACVLRQSVRQGTNR